MTQYGKSEFPGSLARLALLGTTGTAILGTLFGLLWKLRYIEPNEPVLVVMILPLVYPVSAAIERLFGTSSLHTVALRWGILVLTNALLTVLVPDRLHLAKHINPYDDFTLLGSIAGLSLVTGIALLATRSSHGWRQAIAVLAVLVLCILPLFVLRFVLKWGVLYEISGLTRSA